MWCKCVFRIIIIWRVPIKSMLCSSYWLHVHTHTQIYIYICIYIYILVVKEWLHLIISMYKYASPKRSYRDHYREIIQTEQCVMTCNSKFTACVQVQVFRIRYMAIFDCWLRHKLMSFNPMEYQKTRLNRGQISKTLHMTISNILN